MFRLDNILERWCTIYKPISHDPTTKDVKRHAFFRSDVNYANTEWLKALPLAKSPAMIYSTSVDGLLQKNGLASYQHRILVVVKQNLGSKGLQRTNSDTDLDAAECKFYANDIVIDLLAFLQKLKKAACNNFRGIADGDVLSQFAKIEDAEMLRGLQLDNVSWATIPMVYNGWWICEVDVLQVVQRPLCIVPDKYNI